MEDEAVMDRAGDRALVMRIILLASDDWYASPKYGLYSESVSCIGFVARGVMPWDEGGNAELRDVVEAEEDGTSGDLIVD